MIKRLSNNTCAFDAEWVACPDSARRLLDLPPGVDDRSAMEALWNHYRTDEDDGRPFLKYALSRVVTIAAVMRSVDRDGAVSLRLHSRGIDQYSEAQLIEGFLESVAKSGKQLWGYNSGGADVPLLVQRAIALDAPCPAFAKRPNKPWEGDDYFDSRNSEIHKDILYVLGGYGRSAKPTLDEFAAACGIPGKLGISGSDVADLYLAGDVRTIAAYNEADALTTHLAMLRIGHFAGKLSDAQHHSELRAVDDLLEAEIQNGKAHLRQFQERWQQWRN